MDTADNPLTFLLWKWKRKGSWSQDYAALQVNAAARMIKAHYLKPHRIVCITDDPIGISACETMPLWEQPSNLKIELNAPNCYKRLFIFSNEFAAKFPGRVVSFDLDCLVLPGPDGQGITPLFDTDAKFKICTGLRGGMGCCPYNGSMYLLEGGAHPEVWDTFDPIESPAITKALRLPSGQKYYGSDQTWLAHKIPGAPTWGYDDGVLSYSRDMKYGMRGVPENCRVMFFAGINKPWSNNVIRSFPSIAEEYKKYC